MLATRSGGAVGVGAQVRRIDVDGFDFIDFGQDGHRTGRGMDASLCLRCRYPLHTMRTRLEFQAREHTLARDSADDFAKAAVLARVLAQDLHRITLRFSPAAIHAKQVAGEDSGFVATRSRPHLQVDILFVAWILRQQQAPEVGLGGLDFTFDPCKLFGTEGPHASIRIGQHLLGGGQVTLQTVVSTKAFRQRLQAGIFHGQVTKLRRVAGNFHAGEQAADLFEAIGHSL